MKMRSNKLREALTRGDVLVGSFLSFPDPGLVEFTGLCGFDWVLFDGEHEGVSVGECYELVRAADAVGIGTVVRVPQNEPSVILGYAETGVNAILAPHVDSFSAASRLVSALKYPPSGIRGMSPTSRAANYGLTQDPLTYLRSTSDHALPIALIEDDFPMDELDAIVTHPDLRIVTIGPGDLGAAMGFPGEPKHPAVVERVHTISARVSAAGKTLMLPAATMTDVAAALELGARMVVTSNAGMLREAMDSYLTGVRALTTGLLAAGEVPRADSGQ